MIFHNQPIDPARLVARSFVEGELDNRLHAFAIIGRRPRQRVRMNDTDHRAATAEHGFDGVGLNPIDGFAGHGDILA